MKKTITTFLFSLLILVLGCWQNSKHDSSHEHHTQEKADDNGNSTKSPHKSAMATISTTHVHIEYNSPSVRNRIIWGGLVPYEEVWVSGAHMATSMHFYGEVNIAGNTIPEGKYGFFTIPGKEEWTLILNKNWEQHMTDEYDKEEDILRWKVKPDSSAHTEALTYQVISGEEKGSIEFLWEKVKLSFEIAPAR